MRRIRPRPVAKRGQSPFLLKKATVPFLVALLPLAHAQDWQSDARALRPQDTSAQQAAVLDELEQRARAALDSIPRATTQAAAEKARQPLRTRLEESLGFRRLPWPPDLQATVSGVVPAQGYRIEKVIFQTLPGSWAPAHLYLPAKSETAAPAVLFYNGHWWPDSKSRPDFQAFCINMARMGFVVFSFDPFGQGERIEYPGPRPGQSGAARHSPDSPARIPAAFPIARLVRARRGRPRGQRQFPDRSSFRRGANKLQVLTTGPPWPKQRTYWLTRPGTRRFTLVRSGPGIASERR